MHPFFVQAICYGVVVILMMAAVAVFQRGFFWKYAKVRTSFGKYVIVKIRSPLRHHFAIGWVEEGYLIYKLRKDTIRYAINNDQKIFYRCLAVTWVNVDEEKHAIEKQDQYGAVSAFDAPSLDHTVNRALIRPSAKSLMEKIILVFLVLLFIGVLAAIFIGVKNSSAISNLATQIPTWLEGMRGTVVGSSAVI